LTPNDDTLDCALAYFIGGQLAELLKRRLQAIGHYKSVDNCMRTFVLISRFILFHSHICCTRDAIRIWDANGIDADNSSNYLAAKKSIAGESD
jgi:hypothetical protein